MPSLRRRRRPNEFSLNGRSQLSNAQFERLWIGQFSSYVRPDRLKRLLSTKALVYRTVVERLEGRLFSWKKMQDYSPGKKGKTRRFPNRLRSSRNARLITGLDQ
jgi:hypothetical protein